MYSVLKNLQGLLDLSDGEKIEFTNDNTRTAIAVLYYRVILVDGRIRTQELEHFRKVLGETLDVCEDELLLFEAQVLELIRSERSLAHFTGIVKSLPEKKRREILRHMQEISISDKELHEYELSLVEQTAALLGISKI